MKYDNITTTPMPGDFHEAGAAQIGAKTQAATTTGPLAGAEQAVDTLQKLNIDGVLLCAFELMLGQLKEMAAEIERGKIAREQWAKARASQRAEHERDLVKVLEEIEALKDTALAKRNCGKRKIVEYRCPSCCMWFIAPDDSDPECPSCGSPWCQKTGN